MPLHKLDAKGSIRVISDTDQESDNSDKQVSFEVEIKYAWIN